MSVVTNATPLIYLAKIGKLLLLKKLFGKVIIPEEVKKEVVDRGKEKGESDAYIIEQAITEGWLVIEKAQGKALQVKLHPGEEAVLILAVEKKISEVIIDEVPTRTAARILGLTPRGTIYVLLKAVSKLEINLEEFIELLEKLLECGFRLKEEIYLEAIRKAKGIRNEK